MKIVVVGAGWAGCAAALSARKQGAEVILVERTDMILGTGLVGGIMRNNGRFTAAEEMIAMGGGDLFELTDANSLHRNIEFPGHPHASLYNVATMEPLVKAHLESKGVELQLSTRVNDVEMKDGRIFAVHGIESDETVSFPADAYIDTTGTAGPPGQCAKYGNGCVLCILRCPAFGGRVSLTALCGVKEQVGRKGSQIGAMSGSCKLLKESLSRDIADVLTREGVVVIPLPLSLQKEAQTSIKACQQYAIPEFQANLILLDTGHAKLMVPFFPLAALRKIPGLENARYEDPYAGGLGNSIRYVGMSPRNDALRGRRRGEPLLRRREGGASRGPHGGHRHGDPGRVQCRAAHPGGEAADPARYARNGRRDPVRGDTDANRGGPGLQVHLLGIGLLRTDEGKRPLRN